MKKNELIGGVSSFLACFYIIIVNPAILSQAGMSFSAVCTSTIITASFSTILMGLYAKNPIILAPGMGLNAFFAFTVVLTHQVPIDQALGIVFWSGVLFLILTLLKVREKIVDLIPLSIRLATTAGIGVFIAFIGLKNAGIIQSHPATFITFGKLDAVTITFFVGLLLTAILFIRNIIGAGLISILLMTVFSIPIGRFYGDASSINNGVKELVYYSGVFSSPDFSLFFNIDLWGSLNLAFLPIIFTFVFTDMFDTISTLLGVSQAANLLDKDGKPRNLNKSLTVDAIATMFSGLFGTSPTTSFIESAVGVQAGARGGASSVLAGLLFLPFIFLLPLLSLIPSFATTPILVMVGIFMFKNLNKIKWDKLEDALPAFLTVIMIPLTFSISKGLIIGLSFYYLLNSRYIKSVFDRVKLS
ncbi:NCS2 family permease [Bacteriovoracaceae bacterium]|nr:NCS2 family permease [Bacteriovoracaceae bacterium]